MFWDFDRSATLTIILGAKELHRKNLSIKFPLGYYKTWNLLCLNKIVKTDPNPLSLQ